MIINADRHRLEDGCASIRLSPSQWLLFDAMRSGKVMSLERLAHQLYADDPEGGPLNMRNSIMVQMTGLRKRIAPLGLRVVNEWGIGWRIEGLR